MRDVQRESERRHVHSGGGRRDERGVFCEQMEDQRELCERERANCHRNGRRSSLRRKRAAQTVGRNVLRQHYRRSVLRVSRPSGSSAVLRRLSVRRLLMSSRPVFALLLPDTSRVRPRMFPSERNRRLAKSDEGMWYVTRWCSPSYIFEMYRWDLSGGPTHHIVPYRRRC